MKRRQREMSAMNCILHRWRTYAYCSHDSRETINSLKNDPNVVSNDFQKHDRCSSSYFPHTPPRGIATQNEERSLSSPNLLPTPLIPFPLFSFPYLPGTLEDDRKAIQLVVSVPREQVDETESTPVHPHFLARSLSQKPFLNE